MDRDSDADGTLETTYYYHRDGLGSVTAMTDSSGTVVQDYVYDSFGNIKSSTGSVENSYTYTSREWDAEASVYYYRARHYDPSAGRFLQEDPIGFDGGINFYAYVASNPVNMIDPRGLCGCSEICIPWSSKPLSKWKDKSVIKILYRIQLLTAAGNFGICQWNREITVLQTRLAVKRKLCYEYGGTNCKGFYIKEGEKFSQKRKDKRRDTKTYGTRMGVCPINPFTGKHQY